MIRNIDEMSFDEAAQHRIPSPQVDLIRHYCESIDERIRTAATKADAQKIVDEACASLGRECLSELLQSALKAHVQKLFETYWLETE